MLLRDLFSNHGAHVRNKLVFLSLGFYCLLSTGTVMAMDGEMTLADARYDQGICVDGCSGGESTVPLIVLDSSECNRLAVGLALRLASQAIWQSKDHESAKEQQPTRGLKFNLDSNVDLNLAELTSLLQRVAESSASRKAERRRDRRRLLLPATMSAGVFGVVSLFLVAASVIAGKISKSPATQAGEGGKQVVSSSPSNNSVAHVNNLTSLSNNLAPLNNLVSLDNPVASNNSSVEFNADGEVSNRRKGTHSWPNSIHTSPKKDQRQTSIMKRNQDDNHAVDVPRQEDNIYQAVPHQSVLERIALEKQGSQESSSNSPKTGSQTTQQGALAEVNDGDGGGNYGKGNALLIRGQQEKKADKKGKKKEENGTSIPGDGE